ncbi:prenyltransferase/squalene oxidase repeat-containing protein [Rhodopirellula sp. MGV]|uniref:prenyltransferase/squalene oxidase repeat-containing protein n=1 Tax=Rhodopirellula sp. MGV TaxID=2023130 RepID=UPI000B97BF06|nr:prenyltransferase/squalene oxidase repeat-containing protein [Rhodopirellula sp. MGV]OYP37264.1 beta-hydroxylase [Rhodopirellula sp. MGV]PNY38063.1 beta-hydroxylase [Rhodopirellula baltica]
MLSYLQTLTLRLAAGASQIDPQTRRLHGDWLASQQRADGGFAGREGESDPYYTAFALRALWILDALDENIGGRAAAFLRSRLNRREGIVDLISLIFAAAICEMSVGAQVVDDNDPTWADNVANLLESLRTDDGGFAKSPEGRAGSTYQTFLSVLCLELLGRQPHNSNAVCGFIDSQAHADGGYLEIRAAKRPGVNPTAAAIGTLKTLGTLDSIDTEATIDFLSEMQSDEGGFTANTRIPFADLLSSCTAMITLDDLGAIESIDRNAVRRYAESMQMPGGGFAGFQLDQTADVEYTFYGLSALAMCESV